MSGSTELALAEFDVGANAVPLQRVHEAAGLHLAPDESMGLEYAAGQPAGAS